MRTETLEDRTNAPPVTTTLRFTVADGVDPIVYLVDYPSTTIKLEEQCVVIENGWDRLDDLELENAGFGLVKYRSSLTDVLDKSAVRSVFKPEAEHFLKRLTGAKRVVMFNSLARDMRFEPNDDNLGAALNVHVDHDQATYEYYMRQELGSEADAWLARRWAAFNIWKPMRTVESMPLAVCDARTIKADDLIPTKVGTRPNEPLLPRTGLGVVFNPDQRWYYFPQMREDEALILKMWDTDQWRPQWAAHTAFVDPNSPDNAEPRISIDARFVAFY